MSERRENFRILGEAYDKDAECGVNRCEKPASFSIYGPENCHMCGNEIHFCESHFLEFKQWIKALDGGAIDIASGYGD